MKYLGKTDQQEDLVPKIEAVQKLSLDGSTLSITGANSVDLSGLGSKASGGKVDVVVISQKEYKELDSPQDGTIYFIKDDLS